MGYRTGNGCLTAAIVLRCCSVNLERLLNGATPDPSEPARDADAFARLKLTQALQRAKIRASRGNALAASGAASDRRRAVSGGVVGRSVAGAAVPGARHRARPVRGRSRLAALWPLVVVSLAEPRTGLEPARSRLRHPPSPGDRADRHAGRRRTRSRWRCGRRSASARWPRSSASAPACRRRGLRSTIPGRCARWSW